MTIIPKHYLHSIPDHDCWQIYLASVEFKDYFGEKYGFDPYFSKDFLSFLFFFSLLFCFLPFFPPFLTFFFFSSVMQSQILFFLVPSYFITSDRVCLRRLCITPGNFINVEMDVSQWP